MGAVFAGIVRAPVTSIIIIFEMTNNYSMILPLMVSNITSYAVATKLSPVPIYDALLLQDGIRLPHAEKHALRMIPVSAAMTRDVVSLAAGRGGEKLERAAHKNLVRAYPDEALDTVMLKLGRHGISQLPVVSRTKASRLLGIITLHDVARALSREIETEPAPAEGSPQ